MARDSITETVTPDDAARRASGQVGVTVAFVEGAATMPHAGPRWVPVTAKMVVGRGEDADLVVDDPKASRKHASLAPAPDGVVVGDLGSRNGVLADGRVLRNETTLVRVGGIVRLGNTLLAVGELTPGADRVDDQGLVGGPTLDGLRRRIARVGAGDSAVLVRGESGVGKELVARALHRASGRPGELVSMNCAAVPRELIESELFGHARGAYSGAEQAREGLLRLADGGTLFLDELGEMPPAAQAKLLRAIESGEVRGVGDDRPRRVDVRIVSATNASLEDMMAAGTFRDDLYYRVAAITIDVPPLRERRGDVPLLVAHFLNELGRGELGVSADAMQQLMGWEWPGNVRELGNVVRNALSLISADDATIRLRHLPGPIRDAEASAPDLRDTLIAALTETKGNVSAAARRLGMRRAGFYEQMQRLGIDPDAYRSA